MMIPRFGFIQAKKGVWEVVKISTGPWVQYADHEQALAEKDAEIARWKAAHDEMVSRNRLLRARPDLPADLIRAHDEWVRKLAEKEREIQQIREYEFQRGFQEGAAAQEKF